MPPVHLLAGLDRAAVALPYDTAGLDCDKVFEFINHAVRRYGVHYCYYTHKERNIQKALREVV